MKRQYFQLEYEQNSSLKILLKQQEEKKHGPGKVLPSRLPDLPEQGPLLDFVFAAELVRSHLPICGGRKAGLLSVKDYRTFAVLSLFHCQMTFCRQGCHFRSANALHFCNGLHFFSVNALMQCENICTLAVLAVLMQCEHICTLAVCALLQRQCTYAVRTFLHFGSACSSSVPMHLCSAKIFALWQCLHFFSANALMQCENIFTLAVLALLQRQCTYAVRKYLHCGSACTSSAPTHFCSANIFALWQCVHFFSANALLQCEHICTLAVLALLQCQICFALLQCWHLVSAKTNNSTLPVLVLAFCVSPSLSLYLLHAPSKTHCVYFFSLC